MRHDFDPRIQQRMIRWHGDSRFEAIVKDILRRTKPDVIIETGTHMGWTTAWFAENADPSIRVHSVEIDPSYVQLARENLEPYKNVYLHQGSSVGFLQDIIGHLREWNAKPLFWLDAHWWPPIPLQEECKLVASLSRFVALVDDFFCGDFSGDTFVSTLERDANGKPLDEVGTRNDISYVAPFLGRRHWVPSYEPKTGFKGYALFVKGVDYEPPATMKLEDGS